MIHPQIDGYLITDKGAKEVAEGVRDNQNLEAFFLGSVGSGRWVDGRSIADEGARAVADTVRTHPRLAAVYLSTRSSLQTRRWREDRGRGSKGASGRDEGEPEPAAILSLYLH